MNEKEISFFLFVKFKKSQCYDTYIGHVKGFVRQCQC